MRLRAGDGLGVHDELEGSLSSRRSYCEGAVVGHDLLLVVLVFFLQSSDYLLLQPALFCSEELDADVGAR